MNKVDEIFEKVARREITAEEGADLLMSETQFRNSQMHNLAVTITLAVVVVGLIVVRIFGCC